MAKVVRIQSTIDISVTAGLQNKDVTNPDAHIPDRLKISPLWPKATVDIRRGTGYYPAEIVEWATVKALEKDNILTIGQIEEKDDEESEKASAELEKKLNEVEPERKKRKKETLAEITEN